MAEQAWATWRSATERALYGDGGFYRRTEEAPGDHFRTSVHASPLFARALLTLADDARLRTVVDIGAGRGELLQALHRLDPSLHLIGVELAARPAGLPAVIGWTSDLPPGFEALVVANEWLDNIPVDVVEMTADGPRVLEVDPAGAERPAGRPTGPDLAWLERWWPLTDPGARAEVGRPRDEQWAGVVRSLRRGVALAVDYAHSRDSRPSRSSLTGYRQGRRVTPAPDGSCDLTSHVALDACASSGVQAGASGTLLTTQRQALHTLGVLGARPDLDTAVGDPAGYIAGLRDAGEAAELTAPGGLGDFGWLAQTVDMQLPGALRTS